MKRQIVLWGSAACALALLTGCGDSHPSYTSMGTGSSSSGGSSTSSSSSGGNTGVTTADVLSIARMPSETGVPFTVDNGYHFTDTSDMTQPIAVDQ